MRATDETTQLIHKLEREFPVDRWILSGMHIWPIIRLKIFGVLHSNDRPEDSASSKEAPRRSSIKSTPGYRYLKVIYHLFFGKKRLLVLPKSTQILFFSPAGRRIFFRNRRYHRTFGFLCDVLSEHSILAYIVEMESDSHEWSYENVRSLAYTGIPPLAPQAINQNCNDGDLPEYGRFLQAISDSDLQPFSPQFAIAEIYSVVQYILASTEVYQKAIQETNIQLCVVDCFYHWDGFAIIRACHNLRIKTLEIQHGVQGESHPAYSSWLKIPVGGYTVIPDLFWCWDQYSAENINSWLAPARGENRAFVGGNVQLAAFREHRNGQSSGNELIDRIRMSVEEGKKNILVTLQPDTVLPIWFFQVIQVLGESCRWWFRLHPSQSIQELSSLRLDGSCDIHQARAASAPEVLEYMDLHVTENSSCIIEASQMGIPSVSYSDTCESMYPEQIRNRAVEIIKTEQEFLIHVDALLKGDAQNSISSIPDSRTAFLRLLESKPL